MRRGLGEALTQVGENPTLQRFNVLDEQYRKLSDDYPLLWHTACDGDLDSLRTILGIEGLDVNAEQHRLMTATPLFIASQEGHIEVCRVLLAAGADPNIARSRGSSPLFIAAEYGHLDTCRLLVDHGASLDVKDEGGNLLTVASQFGHVEVVKWLLSEHSFDPNFEMAPTQLTPLFLAARAGHEAICQLLLDHPRIDLNIQTAQGITPILIAASRGHSSILRLLADAGADLTKCAIDGSNLLVGVLESGNLDEVKYVHELMTANGNTVEINAKYGAVTPLYLAAARGYYEVVVWLVKEAGADVNLCPEATAPHLYEYNDPPDDTTPCGTSPLSKAASEGHTDVCLFLLAEGADINKGLPTPIVVALRAQNMALVDAFLSQPGIQLNLGLNAMTPIYYALLTKNLEVLRQVVDKGADPLHKRGGETTLHFAANIGDGPACAYLIREHGIDANVRAISDDETSTPIQGAVNGEQTDTIFTLLRNGARPSKEQLSHSLLLGIEGGNLALVEYICGEGIDINSVMDPRYDPPISALEATIFAPRDVRVGVFKVILDAGAEIDRVDSNGNTILHKACSAGDGKLVSLILARDKSMIELTNVNMTTPLSAAVQGSSREALMVLLENGADPNAARETPSGPILLAAVGRGFPVDCIKSLVEHGADVNYMSSQCLFTPLMVAVDRRDIEVVKYLVEEAGADMNIEVEGLTVLNRILPEDSSMSQLAYETFSYLLHREEAQVGGGPTEQGSLWYVTLMHGNESDVARLLALGITPMSFAEWEENEEADTILHQAVQFEAAHLCKAILDRGLVDVNARNKVKATPLHEAVLTGNLEVVKLIVSNGGDRTLRTAEGETALDLASEDGRAADVGEYLQGLESASS